MGVISPTDLQESHSSTTTFHVTTLGCPKNTVDSRGIAQLLTEAGYRQVKDASDADILIVNTCGFIDIAKDESVGALRELAGLKTPGQLLVAAGCLAQRYGEHLRQDVPEVDAFVGTQRWTEIVSVIAKAQGRNGRRRSEERVTYVSSHAEGPSAYVKIADGCDASCAFCVIPQIKGPYKSRPAQEIVEEVRQLAAQGVVEVVLIAQDTGAYGQDLGLRDGLATLLECIARSVPEIPWIRLMYTYPERISRRLIQVLASNPRVCHYLDLPLQHGHPGVLERMRRPKDTGKTRALIRQLREAMPDVALRTTFIVGYPGETQAEFHALLDFIKEINFDHVGVFTYSWEEGTPAAALPQQVPTRVKERRYRQAMELQQRISLANNRRLVGTTLEVLIEGTGELSDEAGEKSEPILVGRARRHAPEVDGLVLVRGHGVAGQIVRVLITEAMEYDLWGEIAVKG
ncbi:MAG: 30S ribosomal protein S12 methylthiotransferase RimO [Chloroflexi bacterium]|nr:30S ribosomal protein S12 methylthiotransferase RimO [Chloroflexota bacterium]